MMVPIPGPPALERLYNGDQQAFNRCDSKFSILKKNGNLVSYTTTKGLLNMPGQNNCFLNSAIQVLWHLDIFRQNFRELSSHSCMAESCIFCALKELFTQFQYSQESALPPDALRHALAKSFSDQRRFQLGFMDDAAECFENILLRIHVHIVDKDVEDICGDEKCIPHQKFAMTLVEQAICYNCKNMSEPLLFTQMVHYVTTSVLCSKAADLKQQGYSMPNIFGSILQHAGDAGDIKKCSSGCGSNVFVKKTLMNFPEIVSLGLVWDSESPSLQKITDVLHCIGVVLHIKDMFHAVFEKKWAEETNHELVGLVTYYGKHYSTFFFHKKLKKWIYFDDAAVREVGPSWEMVVEKCQKGRFQPLLLMFASRYEKQVAVNGPEKIRHSLRLSCSTQACSEKQAVLQKYAQMQEKFKDFRSPTASNMTSAKPQLNNRCGKNVCAPSTPGVSQCFESDLICRQSPVYCNTASLRTCISNFTKNHRQTLNNNCNEASNHIYHNVVFERSNSPSFTDVLSVIKPVKVNEINLIPDSIYHGVYQNCAVSKSNHSDHTHIYKNSDMLDLHRIKGDSSKDSDSAFTEDDPECDMYISRKTVENILNLQKLQRHVNLNQQLHGGVGNRNSNSSLESFDNVHCPKFNLNQTSNKMFKLLPNSSQRRDSGDQSVSCSTSSIKNPLFMMTASRRLLPDLNGSPSKNQCTDSSVPNSSDHGYDSYSVSSSDSYPSINNSPRKMEPRLTQIPEDWGSPDFSKDLDKKLKLVTEEGPPDCDKLCAEADLLLAKSHEKEKEGDMVMAALLSDTAAARARAAMDAPYNNSRSLVSAKMKHSTCVMRSSCLYRKLKDENDERRKYKGHHVRQSSRDSTHSRHSRQGSKDSNSHLKYFAKENSNQFAEDVENFGKNIEIYGTLPKKGNKKKRSTSPCSSRLKEDQIYKDFLDKQRKNIDSAAINTQSSQKFHDSNRSKSIVAPETKCLKKTIESVPLRSPKKQDKSINLITEVDGSLQTKRNENLSQDEPKLLFLPNSNDKGAKFSDTPVESNSSDRRQHKIKRKLIGGFMKRKNRSLPDLRADELSDDCDHITENSEGSIIAALTLSNDISPSNIATVTRGFHQPHFAFVKKELKKRPSLVKVSPPNIQSSTLNMPILNNKHTLASPLKGSGDTKTQSELMSFQNSDCSSRTPFVENHSQLDFSSNFPVQNTTNHLEAASSIPIPNKHAAVFSPNISAVEPLHGEVMQAKNDSMNGGRSFIEELQAKRGQIMNEDGRNELKPMWTASSKVKVSQLPKTAEKIGGMSWVEELQVKQKRMQNPIEKNKELCKKENIETLAGHKNGEGVQPTTSYSNKVTSRSPIIAYPHENIKQVRKNIASVKDLASKFESILTFPKEKVDTNSFSSTTLEPVHPKELIDTFEENNLHQNNTFTSNSFAKEIISAESCKSEKRDIKFMEKVDKCNQGLQQRPQQPPDYETAVQRLEHMRGSLPASSTCDCDKKPVTDSPKKKYPKKSVTFSDEVVLVACAEVDDSGFFKNPLLERVYRKHLECGGKEFPELKASSAGEENDSAKNWSVNRNSDFESLNTAPENLTSCNLCHSKLVPKSSMYCADCSFYMSKYQ